MSLFRRMLIRIKAKANMDRYNGNDKKIKELYDSGVSAYQLITKYGFNQSDVVRALGRECGNA